MIFYAMSQLIVVYELVFSANFFMSP